MIPGFSIGHATLDGPGWLTGTTVVLAPDGAVGGVDVRGGGPGTRETDLLAPVAFMETVHAVVLTGGSAFGLAAADGVMAGLAADGVGFPVRTPDADRPGTVVPIVPAAVIFDLGRGGHVDHRPGPATGRRAYEAAKAAHAADEAVPPTGTVGAGTGAICGGLKGGFGYAEMAATSGAPWRIAAAVVANPVGPAWNPATGRLWADTDALLPAPSPAERRALAEERRRHIPSLNTTIGVVLTDAPLVKSEATKVAQVGHDGLARAVRPVHSLADGDTLFCLASGTATATEDAVARFSLINGLLARAADVVSRACVEAVLAARAAGHWVSYRDVVADCPRTYPWERAGSTREER